MINRLFNKLTANNHAKELIAKGTSALVFRVIGLCLSYVFTILVSRNYGVDAWGVFTLFFALVQICSKIARFGFDKGGVKFIAEYRVQKNTKAIGRFYFFITTIVFVLSFLFSLVIFLNASYIAELFFKDIHAVTYVKYASLVIIPFSITTVNAICLRGLKQIKPAAFLGHPILFALAIIGLLILDFTTVNQEKAIIAFVFSIYLGNIISFILWFRKSGVSLLDKEDTVQLSHIIRVSLPLIFAGSLFLIMGWADSFMLGYFKTTEEVGAYNVISKIARSSSIIIASVDSIFSPKIADFYVNKDYQGLQKLAVYSSKLTFFLTLPIFILICLFPKLILSVFHDSLYGEIIIYSLMILVLTKFVNAITGNVSSILQLTGKQVTYQNIVLISLGINLLLNYLLIPSQGVLGASIASFIAILLTNVLGLIYVKKYYGINCSYIQNLMKR